MGVVLYGMVGCSKVVVRVWLWVQKNLLFKKNDEKVVIPP